MESSTPLVTTSADLRRRTLLRNAPALSPLRKSMDVSHNASLLDTSNDDEERAKRRQQVELQKRLSNISLDRSSNSYNDSFIKEQYILCTHLYTENKITIKNAWKLQIINMLKPLCEKSGKDTLQVAGTSMDICAKVYGLRVDDVHADGLKLATNLARTAGAHQQDGDNDEDDDPAPEGEQAKDKNKAKKKKNRRVNLRGSKNTVAQNPESLCGTLPKLEPTDFTTRVKAETGTIENLLTNIMKETGDGCSFVLFDKGEKLFCDHDKLLKNLDKEDGIDLENLPKLNPANLQINIPFNHFRIEKEYDPNQEDPHMDAEKSQTLQNLPVDDHGFPIYELDGSVHENFDNLDVDMDNDDAIESMHIEIAPQVRGELERIIDFAPKNATADTSEYSYNSIVNTRTGKYIDQIWAGPSHWKLKFIRRSNARFSGRALVQKVANVRKKAEPDMINFDEDVSVDMTKKVSKRKPPTVDINKITLPPFSLAMPKVLSTVGELMLKPKVCPVEKKKEQDKDKKLEFEFSDYNYNNPNDSNYCAQNNDEDNHDSDDIFGDNNDDVPATQEGDYDNLVEAPEMVPTNYVPYALKAKQMDMKKLKASVWQYLTNPTRKEVEMENKIYPTSFSKMYAMLPNTLSQKEKSELSCPLAFVALLHLCNEQNLKLVQHPNYKDFNIHSHP